MRAEAAEITAWTGPTPPSFDLRQLGAPIGTSAKLSGERGDTILVHFFASWCEPCREELPALQRLADRGAPGLKVIAVAVADNDMALRRLLDATGTRFPVLLDTDRAVAKAWNVAALPSTVILDSQHQARLVVDSDYAWDTISPQQLKSRLSSPASNTSAQQSLVTKGERP